jgi:hypothetical protein
MPKLTRAEDIAHRMRSGFDRSYYDSLFAQMQKAFGEQREMPRGADHAGEFPDFPDIRPRIKEIGASSRILNTQFITLSRVAHGLPEPEFTQVDKVTGEVRKQFFVARSRGNGYSDGEWHTQCANAFLDGDGLGVGVVQVGLKANPKTGYQHVHVRHVPILQVLWDQHERSLSRARWVAFMHYLAPDIAVARFGKDILRHVKELHEAGSDQRLEVVRIFEYYDIGYGKGEPTMAIIPHDLGEKPLEIDENPFGCLPMAHYEHFLTPGMRRPMGRIPMLVAGQEAINEAERYMRSVMHRKGYDVYSPDMVDGDQLQDALQGRRTTVEAVRTPTQGERFIERVPAAEVGSSTLAYLSELQRNFNADSGVNDLDRGNMSQQARTLGENMLLDERSKVQSSWSALQFTLFVRRLVEKVEKVAAVGDRDPVEIDLNGVNILLNDPSEPRSLVANFLQEEARVVVSVESLVKQDAEREKMLNMATLEKLFPLVQQGLVDPTWWAEEYLRAAGHDPKEAMARAGMQGQMPMQAPQMPGTPLDPEGMTPPAAL